MPEVSIGKHPAVTAKAARPAAGCSVRAAVSLPGMRLALSQLARHGNPAPAG